MLTGQLLGEVERFCQGKRCLVTGGAGFIGSNLCHRLKELGCEVFCLDKSRSLMGMDVTDLPRVAATFQDWRPQVVFHLAAMTEVLQSWQEPLKYHQVNVGGTLNVLESCHALPGLEALVAASSDKAYGRPSEGQLPFKEQQPLAVQGDPYSCSKRLMDLLCHDWARNFTMPVRVLRCCNVYGPGQRNQSTLITGTVARLLRGDKPTIHHGHDRAVREWLHVDDAVDAYLLAALDASGQPPPSYRRHNVQGSHALNVGSNDLLTVGQVVDVLLALVKQDAGHVTTEEDCLSATVAGLPADCWLDSRRFRSRFPGWSTLSLRDGLQRTVAWMQENHR